MSIATFQKKVFSVSASKKYTLNDLIITSGLDIEAQEKLKDKPSSYIKGETLNTMSFEVPLRLDFNINPRKEIEDWEAIKSKAEPSIFVLGTKQIGKNKWLLKSITVSEQEIDGKGNILKALLKLEFEEFVRLGKAAANNSTGGGSGSGSNKNKTIGFSSSAITPNQYIFDPPEKSVSVRHNPNMPMPI